jgi:hypothetical protein
MIAAHSAAMECYRRAMISDQTFEGRKESLTQANKLSRTYVTLLEALNRHRGKGQQKVTVEHVRARVAAVSALRSARALPIANAYLGLHIGEVFYGNIERGPARLYGCRSGGE